MLQTASHLHGIIQSQSIKLVYYIGSLSLSPFCAMFCPGNLEGPLSPIQGKTLFQAHIFVLTTLSSNAKHYCSSYNAFLQAQVSGDVIFLYKWRHLGKASFGKWLYSEQMNDFCPNPIFPLPSMWCSNTSGMSTESYNGAATTLWWGSPGDVSKNIVYSTPRKLLGLQRGSLNRSQ